MRDLQATLGQLARNDAMRRLQASWTLMIAASWAYTVAIAIVAYDLGGAGAVGLVFLVRSLPAVAGAPLTGLVASTMTAHQALVVAGATVALALAATGALAALGAPQRPCTRSAHSSPWRRWCSARRRPPCCPP